MAWCRPRAGARAGPPRRACAAAPRPPPRSRASKPLREARRLERMLPVDARHLAAQPRRRHHLARVGQALRIERAAQALERVEVGLAEHLRHVLLLVDADAVLPRDRATGLEARVEDPTGQLLRALGLALVAPVEADERVQVPVA